MGRALNQKIKFHSGETNKIGPLQNIAFVAEKRRNGGKYLDERDLGSMQDLRFDLHVSITGS